MGPVKMLNDKEPENNPKEELHITVNNNINQAFCQK